MRWPPASTPWRDDPGSLALPGRREYNTREREISAGVGGFLGLP